MDRCTNSNILYQSCPDKVALPKGAVRTVRERQWLLVSYSQGAWLGWYG